MNCLIEIEIKFVFIICIREFSYFIFKYFIRLVAFDEYLLDYHVCLRIVFEQMNSAFAFVIATVKISVHIKEHIARFIDSKNLYVVLGIDATSIKIVFIIKGISSTESILRGIYDKERFVVNKRICIAVLTLCMLELLRHDSEHKLVIIYNTLVCKKNRIHVSVKG